MTTKKKKKTNLNVFDKYLQQKKYSRGKKDDETEKPKEKVVKVVVPRINRAQLLSPTITLNKRNVRRSSRSTDPNALEEKKASKKHTKIEKSIINLPKKRSKFKKSVRNVLEQRSEQNRLPQNVTEKRSESKKLVENVPNKRSELKKGENVNSKKKNNSKKSRKELLTESVAKQKIEAKEKQIENKRNKRRNGKVNQSLKTQSKIRIHKKALAKKNKSTNQPKTSDNILSSSQSTKTILSNEHNDENYFEDLSAEDNADSSKKNQESTKRKFSSSKMLSDSDRLGVSNNQEQVNDVTESGAAIELVTKDGSSVEKVYNRKHAAESNKTVKRKRKIEQSERESSDTYDPAPTDEPCCSFVSSRLGENVIPKKEYLLMYNDRQIQSYISNGCQSSDTQIVEETTPITKKYQPYMERLKLLTSDAIKKFITDNQQYFVDFKKEIESKSMAMPPPNKKWKKNDEMRESFKCNPFNSDQQLAMYYTLREIFKVPKAHFKECRNFFTVLIPEISCQLFAETFRIKVSFAPRLIKKLYPKPVCPI